MPFHKKHVWILFAPLTTVVAIVIATRSPKESPERLGYVAAYHVVSDDAAFVLWRAETDAWPHKSVLARIDASGTTLWSRELPGIPLRGQPIRVGSGTVGVRYALLDSRAQSEQAHSMVAFDFDGARLWDAVLVPYKRRSRSDAPGSVLDEAAGGAAVADRFIEWVNSGAEWRMIGVEQRTGRRLFDNRIDRKPSVTYAMATHLVWEDRNDEAIQAHALDPAEASPPVELHSLNARTGIAQHKTAAGNGCVVNGDYVTTVKEASRTSLVAFSGGDLDAQRQIASDFDLLGDGRRSSLRSCGIYQNELVFAAETADNDKPELIIVVADRSAVPLRSTRLDYDILRDLRGPLAGNLAQLAPFSGELPRFVPVVVPGAKGPDKYLAMVDLDSATVSWMASIGAAASANLFRIDNRWYLSDVERSQLQLSVFDAQLGKLSGTIRSSGLGSGVRFDRPLLPFQIARRSVWLIPYAKTTIAACPVGILDAASLRPLRASARVHIDDQSSEMSSRITRMTR